MRVIIGALVGGLVLFAWGAVFHMIVPTGEMGLRSLPDERAVVEVLAASVREPGAYLFPGGEGELTPAEEQDLAERYRRGPYGFLAIRTAGEEPFSPDRLLKELGTNVLCGFIAALLLARMSGGYGMRVAAVVLLGLFSWSSISLSHWIWYGFPWDFTLSIALEQATGCGLAGLVLAAMVKPPEAPEA